MIRHITVGTSDMARAVAFYDALLAPLGITQEWAHEDGHITLWRSNGEGPKFFVCLPYDGNAPAPGNGPMTAFLAADPQAVHAAWEAGIAHGGTDDGAPGPRPHYGPDYYGAYLRDPDGNKLHVAV